MTDTEIEELFDNEIPYDDIVRILFDTRKYFDKDFVQNVHDVQEREKRIFDSTERKILRKFYYYGKKAILTELKISSFPKMTYTKKDLDNVLADFSSRLEKYGSKKIRQSMKKRYAEISNDQYGETNTKNWLDYYKKKQKETKWSSFLLVITNKMIKDNNDSLDFIYSTISSTYSEIENYRYLFIEIPETLYNQKGTDITWQVIYKTTIYAENFKLYTNKYFPFKKDFKINKMSSFLSDRFPDSDAEKLANDFYSGISTGYVYEDCFISTDSKHILLSFKKIELDNRPIPCPSCMTTIQSGNSYPELFLKSYECKNPNCPERSKSGRGKRFDDYSTFRYFKMVEGLDENKISKDLYNKWSRDVFNGKNNIHEMLLNFYLWNNETLAVIGVNDIDAKLNNRKVDYISDTDSYFKSDFKKYEDLPIVHLFTELSTLLKIDRPSLKLKDDITIINGDSTEIIGQLYPDQIGSAITSPPYYNAREYSTWDNFLFYLIDMMRNAYSVYNSLCQEGTYLYNVGDVVGNDNVYIDSNMSKRRIPLGAYTALIFELCGFKLSGNIIWDKGSVQSKRHSTINLFTGYIGVVNSYEHVLIFKKKEQSNVCLSKVASFTPVIKINCKGENTYKHTAPYPLEMVDLIEPFTIKDKYVLDPYLGSGTTLKWCKLHNTKGLGIELNKDYYELAYDNVINKLV